jgi:hypothetical protein
MMSSRPLRTILLPSLPAKAACGALALAALLGLAGCWEAKRSPPPAQDPVDAAHTEHWVPKQRDVRDSMEAGLSGPARDPAVLEQGRANRLPETEWKEVKPKQ